MKRLALIAVITLAVMALVGAAFDTSTTGKALPGNAVYCLWQTKGSILFVDSTAKRDTAQIMYEFYGYDSLQVTMKAVGAATADDDSIFLILYTVDWWGTYTLDDTIIKTGNADDGDGITTVYSTACYLSPGVAVEIKQVGTAKKPDSVQVIVRGVQTY